VPAHHRFREDWTPQRIQARAARVGPNVAIFAEVVMRDRKHPEQGYRTCLGVIRPADKFGRDRLDAACQRALEINARSYSSVHSILKNGLDSKPCARATPSRQHAFAYACPLPPSHACKHALPGNGQGMFTCTRGG